MEMKYYNASNNFSAPIPREPRPYQPPQRNFYESKPVKEPIVTDTVDEEPCQGEEAVPVLVNKPEVNFNKDDYILIGLILILLMNGCDDWLLLIVLGYLLFTGKKI